nr:carbohydrate-responsive element-binding protein-like [Pelodiscus sinensis]|eukprot:XP_025035837.1 carbohydrate-responsive element-binding protein-like [Pelodiscus sinensis]
MFFVLKRSQILSIGKIVSPKWKTFKGLKLLQRDKIRLNNAIWRAWYLQYVERRKNPVCNFVTPLECSVGDEHRKPEAVIMEGKYWKRQIEVVIREYHKWRSYFCTQVQRNKDEPESLSAQVQIPCFVPTACSTFFWERLDRSSQLGVPPCPASLPHSL